MDGYKEEQKLDTPFNTITKKNTIDYGPELRFTRGGLLRRRKLDHDIGSHNFILCMGIGVMAIYEGGLCLTFIE